MTPPPPPPPPPTATSIAKPEPTPAPIKTSEPEAKPAPVAKIPTELPKLDSKELDEELAVMAYLCPVAVKRNEKGVQEVGCVACMSDPPELPDGNVEMAPADFFDVHSFVKGSFTRPGAEQIAITMSGCEAHSGNYGGTLVAEKRGAAWALVRYDSGINPMKCLPFRRKDGIDILVCRWLDGHQGTESDRIFTYDFTAGGPDDVEKGFEEVTGVVTNTFSACTMGVAPGDYISASEILNFELKDETKDGTPDLVVKAEIARAKPSKAFDVECKKALAALDNNGPQPDLTKPLGKKKTVTLVYTYSEAKKTFVPTKATEKAF